MILIEKTKLELGIDPLLLTNSSHKKIWVKCDYCGEEYTCSMKNRNFGYKKLPKDSCNKCKFKKREETSLLKYGVKNSAQTGAVREKIKEKNAERLKSKEYKENMKKIMLSRYGVEHSMQNADIRNKCKETWLNKYGVDHPMKNDDFRKNSLKKAYSTRLKSGSIKLIDGKSCPEWAKSIGYSRSHFKRMVNEFGFEKAISMEKNKTGIELLIIEILNSHNLNYDFQFKVCKRVADFRVNNLLIECDGLYWHSDAMQKDSNYHIKKKKIYSENGYKSLFFRADEIQNKANIVESIIKNKLGLNALKYNARDTVFKEISNKECYEFCEKYHLMGGFNGSRSFCLMNNNDIVSIFQVKELKIATGRYDLSRYCTLPNTSISGGFTKLLSNFEKLCKPNYLQTFIDLRYGSGEYLKNFEFNLASCYPSFKWTDGIKTYGRMTFPGNSGYDNGLFRIYDCGQAKYVKVYTLV